MFDWILMRVQPVHPEDGLVDRLASLRIRHLHLNQNNKYFNSDRTVVFSETSVPDRRLFFLGGGGGYRSGNRVDNFFTLILLPNFSLRFLHGTGLYVSLFHSS
jgi:hypothetical protein